MVSLPEELTCFASSFLDLEGNTAAVTAEVASSIKLKTDSFVSDFMLHKITLERSFHEKTNYIQKSNIRDSAALRAELA